jgi:hypothetical protein
MANIDETIETNQTIEHGKEATTTLLDDEKKFTQKDLDKIVSERLGKEKKKFEKEISEVERLATMTAEQKEREKFKKEKEEFENEKKMIQREKMTLQTAKELETLGISSSLAKFIVADDADAVKENITELQTAWQKALDEAVSKRLRGTTPETSTTPTLSEKDRMKKVMYEAAGLKYTK